MTGYYSRPARLARQMRQLLFPRRCPCCRRVLGTLPFCEVCTPRLEELRRGPVMRLDASRHYLGALDGAAAPYRYEGVVRSAILRAKYEGESWTAVELGVEMTARLFGAEVEMHFAEPVPGLVPGAAIGYDGSYLGYATSDGTVINLDGKHEGITSSDGKVLNKDGEVVGEVIPEDIVIDIWGNYKGRVNSLGDVLDNKNENITAVLPGGSTDKNLSLVKHGSVIDFGGNVIGAVNAISAADMALAGIESRIPVDEVIDAMGQVGRRMPVEFRETALGGLAATPTGRRVKQQMQPGAPEF